MKRIIAAAFLLTALTSCSAVEESLPESVENSVVDASDDDSESQDSVDENSDVDNSDTDGEFQDSLNEPSDVGNSNDNSEFQDSVDENSVVDTSDDNKESQDSVDENSHVDNSDADGEFQYSVNKDSIDVIRNGKTVQSINFDTTELISWSERVSVAPEQFLTSSDFDFDGYDDLFIPEMLGTPNIPGKYYKYNPDTGMYEEWEEFNKISTLVRIQQTNDALIEDIRGSAVDYKTTAWFWEGSVLKRKLQRIQKADENNEIIIEDYKFDENDEPVLTGTYKLGEEPPFCNN